MISPIITIIIGIINPHQYFNNHPPIVVFMFGVSIGWLACFLVLMLSKRKRY